MLYINSYKRQSVWKKVIKKKRKKFAELTNREELSFFTVLAFPKASKIGFACKSCCSNSPYHKKLIILIKMKTFNLFST